MHHTPVLIVGGSLVGLSASLFLSMRGVPHVLIEKHVGSSPHPRAMGFTEHTLEFYRAAGIGDRIPQAPPGKRLQRVKAESLAGSWSDPVPWTPGKPERPAADFSPCRGAAIAQDKLEPILRDAARERGAELSYSNHLLEWREGDQGIIATIQNRQGGNTFQLHARYLLACDGADSPIREQLGVRREGVGYLRTLRSVLFHCPEADAFLDRGIQQFQIENPQLSGFLTTYGDGRWVLMFDDDRERGDEELRQSVRTALGRDMAFDLITTGRWEMAGRIAATYRAGRVFLLGDAAHQLPPTRGGFGANTGIDDAWNLAWKLQLVLEGTSGPALLDSYDAERQPIGELRHQQTFARPDYARWVKAPIEAELYGNAAMELGQLMRSGIIATAAPDLPPAADPDVWAGQPGTRAPHLWAMRDEMKISTIDLFAQRFSVISEDSAWITTAKSVAAQLGIVLDAIHVGSDIQIDDREAFRRSFGITTHGISLVRPDGIVAWRRVDRPADAGMQIADALRRAACLAS